MNSNASKQGGYTTPGRSYLEATREIDVNNKNKFGGAKRLMISDCQDNMNLVAVVLLKGLPDSVARLHPNWMKTLPQGESDSEAESETVESETDSSDSEDSLELGSSDEDSIASNTRHNTRTRVAERSVRKLKLAMKKLKLKTKKLKLQAKKQKRVPRAAYEDFQDFGYQILLQEAIDSEDREQIRDVKKLIAKSQLDQASIYFTQASRFVAMLKTRVTKSTKDVLWSRGDEYERAMEDLDVIRTWYQVEKVMRVNAGAKITQITLLIAKIRAFKQLDAIEGHNSKVSDLFDDLRYLDKSASEAHMVQHYLQTLSDGYAQLKQDIAMGDRKCPGTVAEAMSVAVQFKDAVAISHPQQEMRHDRERHQPRKMSYRTTSDGDKSITSSSQAGSETNPTLSNFCYDYLDRTCTRTDCRFMHIDKAQMGNRCRTYVSKGRCDRVDCRYDHIPYVVNNDTTTTPSTTTSPSQRQSQDNAPATEGGNANSNTNTPTPIKYANRTALAFSTRLIKQPRSDDASAPTKAVTMETPNASRDIPNHRLKKPSNVLSNPSLPPDTTHSDNMGMSNRIVRASRDEVDDPPAPRNKPNRKVPINLPTTLTSTPDMVPSNRHTVHVCRVLPVIPTQQPLPLRSIKGYSGIPSLSCGGKCTTHTTHGQCECVHRISIGQKIFHQLEVDAPPKSNASVNVSQERSPQMARSIHLLILHHVEPEYSNTFPKSIFQQAQKAVGEFMDSL